MYGFTSFFHVSLSPTQTATVFCFRIPSYLLSSAYHLAPVDYCTLAMVSAVDCCENLMVIYICICSVWKFSDLIAPTRKLCYCSV